MKVGILTFHDTNNFGSALQTYALFKAIQKMKIECEILDYNCVQLVKREYPRTWNDIHTFRNLCSHILYDPIIRKKYNHIKTFINEHCKVSNKYDRETIELSCNIYTQFMVGSDIVWGLDIIGNDYTYFLDFVKESDRKFSYASSIGNDDFTKEQIDTFKKYLSSFSTITMREKSSANMMQKILNKKVYHVLDPTLLLTKEEWLSLNLVTPKFNKYLLIYFIDNEQNVITVAKKIAKIYKYKIKVVNYGRIIKGTENVKPASIEEFLGLFNNADFIITASYHGMLFSINLNKQFLYYNRAHQSRMTSVANMFDLVNREIKEINYNELKLIDFNRVNAILDEQRKTSNNILESMLKNDKTVPNM